MPSTITGSIGVFSAFPTFEGVFDYVGATVDGVGTTTMAGSLDPSRPLDENSERIFQAVVMASTESSRAWLLRDI